MPSRQYRVRAAPGKAAERGAGGERNLEQGQNQQYQRYE